LTILCTATTCFGFASDDLSQRIQLALQNASFSFLLSVFGDRWMDPPAPDAARAPGAASSPSSAAADAPATTRSATASACRS
jgi:hypothetical protein